MRKQIVPDNWTDTFHFLRSKDEEFQLARRLRISDEMAEFFEKLSPAMKSQLMARIRRDLEDNGQHKI